MEAKTRVCLECKCINRSKPDSLCFLFLCRATWLWRSIPYVLLIKQKIVLNNYPFQLWRAVRLASGPSFPCTCFPLMPDCCFSSAREMNPSAHHLHKHLSVLCLPLIWISSMRSASPCSLPPLQSQDVLSWRRDVKFVKFGSGSAVLPDFVPFFSPTYWPTDGSLNPTLSTFDLLSTPAAVHYCVARRRTTIRCRLSQMEHCCHAQLKTLTTKACCFLNQTKSF